MATPGARTALSASPRGGGEWTRSSGAFRPCHNTLEFLSAAAWTGIVATNLWDLDAHRLLLRYTFEQAPELGVTFGEKRIEVRPDTSEPDEQRRR